MSYQIAMSDHTLELTTNSFKADKGSMLHGGIFNRELAASLTAGALLLGSAIVLAGSVEMSLIHFAGGAVIFAALFVVLRSYVFREPELKTVIDRERGTVEVLLKRALGIRRNVYNFNELADIALRTVTYLPENQDGIAVVEKIALQHGTVIPGFGQRKDYHTVVLTFRGSEAVIMSTTVRAEAEEVVTELKHYMDMPLERERGSGAEKN